MQTSSPRLGPNAAGSRGARDNAHVVTLIQEALCSGDARCVVEAVEKACRLKGLPVPHELYGEMTLESLIAVMAAIGLDLRTESLRSSSTAPTSGPTALRAPAFLLLKDNGFAHGPLRQGFRA